MSRAKSRRALDAPSLVEPQCSRHLNGNLDDSVLPILKQLIGLLDLRKWIRLKHCNLSTVPKKDAQNQAP